MLEYHWWVMGKALETNKGGQWPAVTSILEADLQMRTKWMLSWVQNEGTTFTEVVEKHRCQSAYLFAGLTTEVRPPQNQNERPPAKRAGSFPAPEERATKRLDAQPIPEDSQDFQLDKKTADGRLKWFFYNKKSCKAGDRCKFDHSCNWPKCHKKHARVDHHPRA